MLATNEGYINSALRKVSTGPLAQINHHERQLLAEAAIVTSRSGRSPSYVIDRCRLTPLGQIMVCHSLEVTLGWGPDSRRPPSVRSRC